MRRRQFLASGVAAGSLSLAAVPAAVRAGNRRERPATGSLHYGLAGYDVAVDVETGLDDDAPASLDVTVAGDRVDRGESVQIRISVTNEIDDAVTVSTGPPLPFGALAFGSVDGEGGFLAWGDDYGFEEPERWADCQRPPAWRDSIESTTVDPGGTLSSTFRLSALTHGVRPGTYEGTLRFGVSREGSDEAFEATVEPTASVDPSRPAPTADHERSVSADPRNAEDFDGRVDVEVLDPLTETHPGLVEVSFTSEWDRQREVETLRAFPIGQFVGRSEDGDRLVLLDADLYAPGYVRRDEEWRSTVVPCQDRSYRWTDYFEPGESVDKRYVVAAHPEDGFPASGEYEFTARYETGGEDSLTKKVQAADLGFVLSLGEAPDGYRSAETPRDAESRGESPATQTATATPDPTSTPEPMDGRTETRTENATASPEATAAGGPTETPAGPEDTTADDAGVEAQVRGTPGPETQAGFGVGAALAGLSGWLAATRRGNDGE